MRQTVRIALTRPLRGRGLTLVELIIVLSIFGVIATAMFLTFLVSQNSYLTNDVYIHVQQQARRALDSMTTELRGAGGTVTAAGGQLTFQLALGYNLAAPCPPNALCWGAKDQNGANQSGWSIRYRLSGTQLVREILNGAVVQPGTRVLGNDISQLAFTYVGGATRIVTIQLQARQVSWQLPGGAIGTGTLSARVRLRNS